MNYLTVIVSIAFFSSACTARLPRSANPTAEEETRSDNVIKRSAPQPTSQQGWVTHGYKGPLAMLEIRPDGTLVETPEVMAARAAHLAALEAARASNPDMDNGEYDPHKYGDHQYGVVSHAEDLAKSILMYQTQAKGHGYTSDSTAVNEAGLSQPMMASAVPEAAHGIWKTNNAAGVGSTDAVYGPPLEQNKPYFGHLAMLQVRDTGFLANTPEVDTARKTHLKALAEALAAAESWKTKNTQHQPWN